MQEVHREIGDRVALVAEQQPAARHESAELGRLHVLAPAELEQERPLFRRHGEHHALLCFGYPDLGI